MTMIASVYKDFAGDPLIAGTMLLAWGVLIGLGLWARRFRHGSWSFEWLVWTYVVMAMLTAIPVAGTILSGGIFLDQFYFLSLPLYAVLSLITMLIIALLWPLLWVAGVVASLVELDVSHALVIPLVIVLIFASLVSFVIATAIQGLPGRIQPLPHPDDQI